MDPAPPPPLTAVSPPPPAVMTAWPRTAQLATAFLLGLATALLAVQVYNHTRWSSRPTALERAGPAYRIDLNEADRAELLQIPGIGDSLTDRIEAYRRVHGRFHTV